MKQRDLTWGIDVRGDTAIFIDCRHLREDGWSFDDAVTGYLRHANGVETVFFRLIEGGRETARHGWVHMQTGKVERWVVGRSTSLPRVDPGLPR